MRAAVTMMLCAVALPLIAAGATAKPVEQTIYAFQGAKGLDGFTPQAALIADKKGNLYGTTTRGGGASTFCETVYLVPGNPSLGPGCGVVFELTPPAAGKTNWTETVLHKFSGPDGAEPAGGLAMDASGNLYGMTYGGGTAKACVKVPGLGAGCGVAFKLTPPAAGKTAWTETVLHDFDGAGGARASAATTLDAAGNLYSITTAGGTATKACPAPTPGVGASAPAGCGIAFKLSRPDAGKTVWTETVLHDFGTSADGIKPSSSLIFDGVGNLYGTTVGSTTKSTACPGQLVVTGGGCGTVFKLTPPGKGGTVWTETILYRMAGGTQSPANPLGGLAFDKAGNLYGTSVSGGSGKGVLPYTGTVFELSPPAAGKTAWTPKIIHDFGNGTDGAAPLGGVIVGAAGNLYGTTLLGGASYIGGAVFKLSAPAAAGKAWTETILASFSPKGPNQPLGGLLIDKTETLYGTTSLDGGAVNAAATAGEGAVFEITP